MDKMCLGGLLILFQINQIWLCALILTGLGERHQIQCSPFFMSSTPTILIFSIVFLWARNIVYFGEARTDCKRTEQPVPLIRLELLPLLIQLIEICRSIVGLYKMRFHLFPIRSNLPFEVNS